MNRIVYSFLAIFMIVWGAHADHGASPDEKVVYKGELAEGQSVTGSVSDRVRREWYTFNVQANQAVTFSATATTTGLPVNIGVLKGQVAKGKTVEDLELQGGFLGLSNNAELPNVSLTITPNFTGVVSVYVARFIDGQAGDYTATVSISKVPIFTSRTSDNAGALTNYSFAVLVTGEPTLTSSTLPAGLALNGTSLEGIPTVTGSFFITFTATNAFGTTTQNFSLSIAGPIVQATVLDPDNTPVPTTTVFSDTPITLTALVAQGGPTFSWSFSDGTTATGNPVAKTFTVATGEQTFFVSLTTNDGVSTFSSSLSITVSAPISTLANTSQGLSVRNPDDGVAVSVQKSMGGVVGLAINPESAAALSRVIGDFEISTEYNGLFGSPARSAIAGARPVAKFTQPGIVVAKTTVIPTRTKTPTSTTPRKSRKTLVISESELGVAQSGLVDNRSSKALTPQTLKGKFGLGGSTKDDTVSFKGTFLLPMGVTPGQSQQVSIAIGNVIDTVTIDEKGKAMLPSSAGLIKKLSIKLPKLKDSPTTVGNEVATLDFSYQAQALVTQGFDTEGVSADATDLDPKKRTAARMIQVLLKFAGVGYEIPADVTLKVGPKNDRADVILTRRAN